MNPFEFINSISSEREIKFTDEVIEEYFKPYLAMQFFGNFPDTVSEANMVNTLPLAPSNFDTFIMLHSIIEKRRRYNKKEKKDKEIEDKIKILMEYYNYSREKAKDVLNLHTEEMFECMKHKEIGGKMPTNKKLRNK